jgi:hypothetical protein
MYLQKVNKQKLRKKLYVGILGPLMKKAGSGYVSLLYGSADPDPYQAKCHGSTTLQSYDRELYRFS